jgi:nucleotide-binding universal stress UspA family protein
MTTMPPEMKFDGLQVVPGEGRQEVAHCQLFSPIPICQIMVPVSGAPFDERALPHALTLALAATGTSILLVFVETPASQSEARTSDIAATDPVRYLVELRERLGPCMPQVKTRVVRAETAARGCLDAECTDGTDLVMLAISQPTDAARRSVGVVATELIRSSRVPVLLIPPEAPPSVAAVRVLVPLDGSLQAEHALFPLIALANAGQHQYIKEIELLTVCEEQQAMSAATAYLEDVHAALERVVARTVHVHTQVVHDKAAEAIARCVCEPTARHFDLLAMTTRGQGGYGGKLFGGVADYVLPRAYVPMLVVNPRRQ